jgi:lipid A disaccharide synthetase
MILGHSVAVIEMLETAAAAVMHPISPAVVFWAWKPRRYVIMESACW